MKSRKIFQWVIAIVSWLALVLQFYLMMQNRVANVPETIIRFFSFFTILTNLLVAICFTGLVVKNKTNFFSKPSVLTAITVYIFIVGLVYNIVLRSVWDPKGLQLYVDEGLHVATPVLCLLYWILFVPARAVHLKNIFPWLLYPLIYLLYVLIRGAISHFYPYPFLNVDELGYQKTIANSFYITLAFIIVSILLVGLAHVLKKEE